jgi:hypothetical protein
MYSFDVEPELPIQGRLSPMTLMVMPLLVAVLEDTQFAEDVKTQLTTSPSIRVVVVNVSPVIPTLNPFTTTIDWSCCE